MKKTEGRKSGDTVPLIGPRKLIQLSSNIIKLIEHRPSLTQLGSDLIHSIELNLLRILINTIVYAFIQINILAYLFRKILNC
jgi:hypothetical protein